MEPEEPKPRTPFITYREKDSKGILRYYILQKDFPHNLFIILAEPKHDAIVQSPIPAYNLFVVYSGVLEGNFIHVNGTGKHELQNICNSAAAWFWCERIVGNEKKFDKFKIKSNVPASTK